MFRNIFNVKKLFKNFREEVDKKYVKSLDICFMDVL